MPNSFSLKKIRYNAVIGTVIYKSKKIQRRSKGGRKNFKVFGRSVLWTNMNAFVARFHQKMIASSR